MESVPAVAGPYRKLFRMLPMKIFAVTLLLIAVLFAAYLSPFLKPRLSQLDDIKLWEFVEKNGIYLDPYEYPQEDKYSLTVNLRRWVEYIEENPDGGEIASYTEFYSGEDWRLIKDAVNRYYGRP